MERDTRGTGLIGAQFLMLMRATGRGSISSFLKLAVDVAWVVACALLGFIWIIAAFAMYSLVTGNATFLDLGQYRLNTARDLTIWIAIGSILCVGVMVVCAYLRGVFETLVARDPFVPENARRFAAIGIVLAIMEGAGMFVATLVSVGILTILGGSGLRDFGFIIFIGIIVGTFGGALLASVLDVRLLTVVFTLLIYYISAQMLFGKKPEAGAAPMTTAGLNLSSAIIGVISSLTATGGAALVVAYLVKRGIAIHRAIGSAAAIGWPLAAAGTAGFLVTGFSQPGLPQYSLGFIYLPALAGIVVASMSLAPLGARLAHRTPGALLKKIFAAVLFTLATKMLISFF